jgi:hypothetical protein
MYWGKQKRLCWNELLGDATDPEENVSPYRFVDCDPRKHELNCNQCGVRIQLHMRCPCTITVMFIHKASSYNATPQLYTVTTAIICCKRERGSMLWPGVHQSISITNNVLFKCSIIINFHVHSQDTLESEEIKNIGNADMIEWLVQHKRFHEAYDWSSGSPTIGWLNICSGNERRAFVWVGNPRVILLEFPSVDMRTVWLSDTFPCVCSSLSLSRRRDKGANEFSFYISLCILCVKLSFWNSGKNILECFRTECWGEYLDLHGRKWMKQEKFSPFYNLYPLSSQYPIWKDVTYYAYNSQNHNRSRAY